MPRFPRFPRFPRRAQPIPLDTVFAPQPIAGSAQGDPNPPAPPSILRIPDAALADIRALEVLIDQHTRTIRALEREITLLVSSGCQVDLVHEHWELDSRHGLVERKEPRA